MCGNFGGVSRAGIYSCASFEVMTSSVMKKMTVFVLLLLLAACADSAITDSCARNTSDQCPPWTSAVPASSEFTCVCLHNYKSEPLLENAIKCDQDVCRTFLVFGHCMTYDETSNATVVGSCPYGEYWHLDKDAQLALMLPARLADLNNFMCEEPLNRRGQLCAKCINNSGPGVFSLDYRCISCSKPYSGWALYIFMELFPLTIFFIIVLVFRISVTSGALSGFVLFSQMIVVALSYGGIEAVYYHALGIPSEVIVKFIVTLYGFWNLDFFRRVIPPFCVSHDVNNIHAVALQYISAFYPLCLVALTFTCMELHARNFRLIVWLWKPFHRCFRSVRQTWHSPHSTVDAFATFLLLSYSKLLVVSCFLLYPIYIYNTSGEAIAGSPYLFMEPTLQVFSQHHLPYAILAVFVLCTFVAIPPLLLLVYPTKTFQRYLGYCNIRWLTLGLHAFVDTFQGCYKNGTNSKRDFRVFSALYFILRIVVFLTRLFVNSWLYWVIPAVLFMVSSLLFAHLRPYRRKLYNVIDSLLLALLALLSLLGMSATYSTSATTVFVIVYILLMIPLLYVLVYVIYKLMKHRAVQNYFEEVRARRHNRVLLPSTTDGQGREVATEGTAGSTVEESLPDRITHPEHYVPVLSTPLTWNQQRSQAKTMNTRNYGTV